MSNPNRKLSVNGVEIVLTDDGEMYFSGDSPLTARKMLEVQSGMEIGEDDIGATALISAAREAMRLLEIPASATKAEMREQIRAALDELEPAFRHWDSSEGRNTFETEGVTVEVVE